MKALKVFNIIAIGVPILVALIGFIDEMFFFFAIISLIFTGIVQTIVAVVFWAKNTGNHLIKIYFAVSAVFLFYVFGYKNFDLGDALEGGFWIIPIALVVYLSFIIHTQKNTLAEKQK